MKYKIIRDERNWITIYKLNKKGERTLRTEERFNDIESAINAEKLLFWSLAGKIIE